MVYSPDKEKYLQVIFFKEDFKLIEEASKIKSLKWASFVRSSAISEARRILKLEAVSN